MKTRRERNGSPLVGPKSRRINGTTRSSMRRDESPDSKQSSIVLSSDSERDEPNVREKRFSPPKRAKSKKATPKSVKTATKKRRILLSDESDRVKTSEGEEEIEDSDEEHESSRQKRRRSDTSEEELTPKRMKTQKNLEESNGLSSTSTAYSPKKDEEENEILDDLNDGEDQLTDDERVEETADIASSSRNFHIVDEEEDHPAPRIQDLKLCPPDCECPPRLVWFKCGSCSRIFQTMEGLSEHSGVHSLSVTLRPEENEVSDDDEPVGIDSGDERRQGQATMAENNSGDDSDNESNASTVCLATRKLQAEKAGHRRPN